jgi:hypothetical protein
MRCDFSDIDDSGDEDDVSGQNQTFSRHRSKLRFAVEQVNQMGEKKNNPGCDSPQPSGQSRSNCPLLR